MKYAIISGEYDYASHLSEYGFNVIKTVENKAIQKGISYHADMNCVRINNKLFLHKSQLHIADFLKNEDIDICVINEDFSKEYPKDVPLNIAVFNNTVIANRKTALGSIMDFIDKSGGFKVYNVKQGYSACSTLFVSDNAVITGDDGIYNAIKQDFDVLKISNEGILLNGYNNGFIGGSAKLIEKDTMLFFGDIKAHKDYDNIKSFLSNHNVNIECFGGVLQDIGGVVLLRLPTSSNDNKCIES